MIRCGHLLVLSTPLQAAALASFGLPYPCWWGHAVIHRMPCECPVGCGQRSPVLGSWQWQLRIGCAGRVAGRMGNLPTAVRAPWVYNVGR